MGQYYAKLEVYIEADNKDEAQEMLEKIAKCSGCVVTPIGEYSFGIARDVEELT